MSEEPNKPLLTCSDLCQFFQHFNKKVPEFYFLPSCFSVIFSVMWLHNSCLCCDLKGPDCADVLKRLTAVTGQENKHENALKKTGSGRHLGNWSAGCCFCIQMDTHICSFQCCSHTLLLNTQLETANTRSHLHTHTHYYHYKNIKKQLNKYNIQFLCVHIHKTCLETIHGKDNKENIECKINKIYSNYVAFVYL